MSPVGITEMDSVKGDFVTVETLDIKQVAVARSERLRDQRSSLTFEASY
jgi:hypothetical protein